MAELEMDFLSQIANEYGHLKGEELVEIASLLAHSYKAGYEDAYEDMTDCCDGADCEKDCCNGENENVRIGNINEAKKLIKTRENEPFFEFMDGIVGLNKVKDVIDSACKIAETYGIEIVNVNKKEDDEELLFFSVKSKCDIHSRLKNSIMDGFLTDVYLDCGKRCGILFV